jgi:hypothetical protein
MTPKKEWSLLILIYGLPGIALSVVHDVSVNMIGARLLFLSFIGFIGWGFTLGIKEGQPSLAAMLRSGCAAVFRYADAALSQMLNPALDDRFSLRALITPEREVDRLDWKKVFHPCSFLLPLLLLVAALICNARNQNTGFYLLISGLLVLYLIGNNEVKWWAFLGVALSFIIHGYHEGCDFNTAPYFLFKQWCVFHIVRYRWWYALPGLVFFISLQKFWIPDGKPFGLLEEVNMFLIHWGIALYVMRYRYGYIYLLFIFMMMLDSSFPGIFTDQTGLSRFEVFINCLPYVIPPFLLWFKKEISQFYKIIIVIAIVASCMQGRAFAY